MWLWSGLKDIGDGCSQGLLLEGSKSISLADTSDGEAILELDLRPPMKPKDPRILSRLECVKHLFLAFANRCQAYAYATEIGLITFSSQVETPCPLTPHFEVFKAKIDSVEAKGDTKLYDALQAAAEQLVAFRAGQPQTKLRILCLTDGRDSGTNGSTVEAHAVCRLLQQHEITLDAVCIGNEPLDVIKTLAKATYGYCFNPTRLRDALKLNELETLLTVFERPVVSSRHPPISTAAALRGWVRVYAQQPLDVCDDDTVPPRRVTEGLDSRVQNVQQALDAASSDESARPAAADSPSSECKREILAQLRKMHRTPHSAVDIFPSETDLTLWKVRIFCMPPPHLHSMSQPKLLATSRARASITASTISSRHLVCQVIMQGPDGSSYAEGTWLLYVRFPLLYPVSPPEVRFVTVSSRAARMLLPSRPSTAASLVEGLARSPAMLVRCANMILAAAADHPL